MSWKSSSGVFAIGVILMAGAFAFCDGARAAGPVAVANPNDAATANASYAPPTVAELREFDQFLDDHQLTARALLAQAGLVDQPKFQQNHPQLMEFLRSHPNIRGQLIGHPYWFIRREHRYQEFKQFDHDLTRDELDQFDNYLEEHVEIAEALKSDPRLLDDQQFLRNHNELRSFMAAHPKLAAQMQRHPDWIVTATQPPVSGNGVFAPSDGNRN